MEDESVIDLLVERLLLLRSAFLFFFRACVPVCVCVGFCSHTCVTCGRMSVNLLYIVVKTDCR